MVHHFLVLYLSHICFVHFGIWTYWLTYSYGGCCIQIEVWFELCQVGLSTMVGMMLGPLVGSFWFLCCLCPVVGGVVVLFMCPGCGLVYL